MRYKKDIYQEDVNNIIFGLKFKKGAQFKVPDTMYYTLYPQGEEIDKLCISFCNFQRRGSHVFKSGILEELETESNHGKLNSELMNVMELNWK
jgi:hypothetical protein